MESEPFHILRINLHKNNEVQSYLIHDAGASMIIQGLKLQLCEIVAWLGSEQTQVWHVEKEGGGMVVMDDLSSLSAYIPKDALFHETNPLCIEAYVVLSEKNSFETLKHFAQQHINGDTLYDVIELADDKVIKWFTAAQAIRDERKSAS